MATKIHHNTTKKAKAHGIRLVVEDGDIVAYKGDVRLASGLQGNVVLDTAITKLGGAVIKVMGAEVKASKAARKAAKKVRKVAVKGMDDEDFDEDGEPDPQDDEEGKSIVKRKYKTKYRPFKMTNGDDLAQQMKAHLNTAEGDDGKPRIDAAKLKRFAQANGVWDPAYVKLNVGQRRMNLGNRLRAKIRRDQHVVVWAS